MTSPLFPALRLKLAIAAAVLGAQLIATTTVLAASRNPQGESAHYEIDTDNRRTSREIRSGEMHASVGERREDSSEGITYDINIDYSFRTITNGRQTGSSTLKVPEAFFSPEFMANLRQSGEWHSPKFSIRYLGSADVTTIDGHFYPGSDGILIHDIRDAGDDIEDLEITAMIFPDVPVLGAVKIDATGRYRGIPLKAGGDYLAP